MSRHHVQSTDPGDLDHRGPLPGAGSSFGLDRPTVGTPDSDGHPPVAELVEDLESAVPTVGQRGGQDAVTGLDNPPPGPH